MGLTAGAISKIAVGTTTDTVSATAATSGTSPYTYQYYRSTVSGFTPSSVNAVSGATSLSLSDTGLNPGTTYYYKQIAIDSASTPASVTTAQLSIVTAPVQSQNQFLQSPIVGQLDQMFNYNTQPAMVDVSETGTLYSGTAVKMVTTSTGVPKIVQCTSNSDVVLGFVNYPLKDISFVAGNALEISKAGNVMYMISVGAIDAGAQVQLDLTYTGGVKAKGSAGAQYVGYALDAATGDGQLLRVQLTTPSFTVFS